MAQMSWLREKIGGYKLVRIEKYRDISYLSEWEVKQGFGAKLSHFYYKNRRGKIVMKNVDGWWELEEELQDE